MLLTSMGVRAYCRACADMGARSGVHVNLFWSEQSACSALGHCSQYVVAAIFGIIGPSDVHALPLGVADRM